jgi:hypothetical protein
MDEELEALVLAALCDAFWNDFSALANRYLEAAKGLDVDTLEMQMGDHTSIYGRDDTANTSSVSLDIRTQNDGVGPSTTKFATMVDAIAWPTATKIYLCDKLIFEKQKGEWYFVD